MICSQVLGIRAGTSLEGDVTQPSNSSLLIDNGRHVVDISALLSAGRVQSLPQTTRGRSLCLARCPAVSGRTRGSKVAKQNAQEDNREVNGSGGGRQWSLTDSHLWMARGPALQVLPWQNLQSQVFAGLLGVGVNLEQAFDQGDGELHPGRRGEIILSQNYIGNYMTCENEMAKEVKQTLSSLCFSLWKTYHSSVL